MFQYYFLSCFDFMCLCVFFLPTRRPISDPKRHNLVIVKPGSRLEIVTAAATMGAAGMANSFVPQSDKVIAYTPLVLTSNTYKLYFKAPAKPGKYEYICTYPGHGLTMWGTLNVK